MGEVSTIGLDIAKSVFQVHGVDAHGAVVVRKRLSRAKVLEFFSELSQLLEMMDGPEEFGIPKMAWVCLMGLAEQYQRVEAEIGKLEQCIQAWHRSSELSRRLEEIPGVGPIVATALVGTIADPQAFASGRHMAAWIGLVPQQNSTGGKDRLGGISKQGNRYLRWLLVAGAMAVIRYAKKHGYAKRPWLARLIERKPTKVAAVALANKIARIAWVIMARGERYRAPALQAA